MSGVPYNRRLWATYRPVGAGKWSLHLTPAEQPDTANAAVAFFMRGALMQGLPEIDVPFVSDLKAAAADVGLLGGRVLGEVTIAQTATVAMIAGVRRVTVPVPASLGLAKGDAVMLLPEVAIAGYAIHDAVATSATQLSVGLTGPALALGASFSIPCRLVRFTLPT